MHLFSRQVQSESELDLKMLDSLNGTLTGFIIICLLILFVYQ